MTSKGQLSGRFHSSPSVLGVLYEVVGCYLRSLQTPLSSAEAVGCRRQHGALFCLSAAVVNLPWSQTSEDLDESMLPVSTSSVRTGEPLVSGVQPSCSELFTCRFLFESFRFLFSGHFTWEKYLKETCAIPAPAHCFKQVRGCKQERSKGMVHW